MKNCLTERALLLVVTMILTFTSCAALAESASAEFPKKPIQIICPVNAGGDTDRNTRVLALALEKYLGISVVVTNVDGGATVIGMQQCLTAEPDGYTLVVNGTDMFVPNMMGTTDVSLDSFKTVGIPLIDNTTVLAVHKDAGFADLKELVDKSIAEPNSIEYGGKIGATNQMCGVAMNTVWGAQMRFMDVGNNAAKVTALLSRQTNVINLSYSVALDYFVAGEFIPLVLLGAEKNELLPNVPMATEYGYENVDFSKFFWVGTHPDTPDDVMAVLYDALEKASKDADFVASIEGNYLTPVTLVGEEAHSFAKTFYEETMEPYKEAFLAAQ